uniref:Uncharacterized protein n=1 Tax=Caenorhabditis japonica TaxID=281687 RepID=A0A8R1DR69_CAEJA
MSFCSENKNKIKNTNKHHNFELCTKLNYVYTSRQCDEYLNYLEELRRIIFGKNYRNMSTEVTNEHSINYHTHNGRTLVYQLEDTSYYGISLSAIPCETESVTTETFFAEQHVLPQAETCKVIPPVSPPQILCYQLPLQVEERMRCCLVSSSEIINEVTSREQNERNSWNMKTRLDNYTSYLDHSEHAVENQEFEPDFNFTEDVSGYGDSEGFDENVDENFAVLEDFAAVLEESESVFEEVDDDSEYFDYNIDTSEEVMNRVEWPTFSNLIDRFESVAHEDYEHWNVKEKEKLNSPLNHSTSTCSFKDDESQSVQKKGNSLSAENVSSLIQFFEKSAVQSSPDCFSNAGKTSPRSKPVESQKENFEGENSNSQNNLDVSLLHSQETLAATAEKLDFSSQNNPNDTNPSPIDNAPIELSQNTRSTSANDDELLGMINDYVHMVINAPRQIISSSIESEDLEDLAPSLSVPLEFQFQSNSDNLRKKETENQNYGINSENEHVENVVLAVSDIKKDVNVVLEKLPDSSEPIAENSATIHSDQLDLHDSIVSQDRTSQTDEDYQTTQKTNSLEHMLNDLEGDPSTETLSESSLVESDKTASQMTEESGTENFTSPQQPEFDETGGVECTLDEILETASDNNDDELSKNMENTVHSPQIKNEALPLFQKENKECSIVPISEKIDSSHHDDVQKEPSENSLSYFCNSETEMESSTSVKVETDCASNACNSNDLAVLDNFERTDRPRPPVYEMLEITIPESTEEDDLDPNALCFEEDVNFVKPENAANDTTPTKVKFASTVSEIPHSQSVQKVETGNLKRQRSRSVNDDNFQAEIYSDDDVESNLSNDSFPLMESFSCPELSQATYNCMIKESELYDEGKVVRFQERDSDLILDDVQVLRDTVSSALSYDENSSIGADEEFMPAAVPPIIITTADSDSSDFTETPPSEEDECEIGMDDPQAEIVVETLIADLLDNLEKHKNDNTALQHDIGSSEPPKFYEPCFEVAKENDKNPDISVVPDDPNQEARDNSDSEMNTVDAQDHMDSSAPPYEAISDLGYDESSSIDAEEEEEEEDETEEDEVTSSPDGSPSSDEIPIDESAPPIIITTVDSDSPSDFTETPPSEEIEGEIRLDDPDAEIVVEMVIADLLDNVEERKINGSVLQEGTSASEPANSYTPCFEVDKENSTNLQDRTCFQDSESSVFPDDPNQEARDHPDSSAPPYETIADLGYDENSSVDAEEEAEEEEDDEVSYHDDSPPVDEVASDESTHSIIISTVDSDSPSNFTETPPSEEDEGEMSLNQEDKENEECSSRDDSPPTDEVAKDESVAPNIITTCEPESSSDFTETSPSEEDECGIRLDDPQIHAKMVLETMIDDLLENENSDFQQDTSASESYNFYTPCCEADVKEQVKHIEPSVLLSTAHQNTTDKGNEQLGNFQDDTCAFLGDTNQEARDTLDLSLSALKDYETNKEQDIPEDAAPLSRENLDEEEEEEETDHEIGLENTEVESVGSLENPEQVQSTFDNVRTPSNVTIVENSDDFSENAGTKDIEKSKKVESLETGPVLNSERTEEVLKVHELSAVAQSEESVKEIPKEQKPGPNEVDVEVDVRTVQIAQETADPRENLLQEVWNTVEAFEISDPLTSDQNEFMPDEIDETDVAKEDTFDNSTPLDDQFQDFSQKEVCAAETLQIGNPEPEQDDLNVETAVKNCDIENLAAESPVVAKNVLEQSEASKLVDNALDSNEALLEHVLSNNEAHGMPLSTHQHPENASSYTSHTRSSEQPGFDPSVSMFDHSDLLPESSNCSVCTDTAPTDRSIKYQQDQTPDRAETCSTEENNYSSEQVEPSSVVEEVSYFLTTVCVAACAMGSSSSEIGSNFSSSTFNCDVIEDASKYIFSNLNSDRGNENNNSDNANR